VRELPSLARGRPGQEGKDVDGAGGPRALPPPPSAGVSSCRAPGVAPTPLPDPRRPRPRMSSSGALSGLRPLEGDRGSLATPGEGRDEGVGATASAPRSRAESLELCASLGRAAVGRTGGDSRGRLCPPLPPVNRRRAGAHPRGRARACPRCVAPRV
jgi:hypothetical protein